MTAAAAARRETTAKDFIFVNEGGVERMDGLFRVGDDVGERAGER